MNSKQIEIHIRNLLRKRNIDVKNNNLVRDISIKIESKLKNNYHKNRKHKDNIIKNNRKYLVNKIISIYDLVEQKIEKKEITIDDIFDRNPIRICPNPWKESILKVENEKNHLSNQKNISNCNKDCTTCGEQNVFEYEILSRGLDEGKMAKYICLSCNHTWSGDFR